MSSPDGANFRELLSRDHLRLDALLASILELTHVDLQPDLDDQWAVYEGRLLSHLDAEEMFLLPGLAKHDPRCADVIRADHAKARALVAEIGVGLDLHIVREDQMLELATFLRAHAKMEEGPLYTWANTALPESHFASALRRLRATWHGTSPAMPQEKGKPRSSEVPPEPSSTR